jgi:hypothetical protein
MHGQQHSERFGGVRREILKQLLMREWPEKGFLMGKKR